MGLSDYYEDREYRFEMRISELEEQLAEARAENAALVAEFQRLADEPPTLEEIAADLDKIEMLEKELAEARAEIERLKEYTTCTLVTIDSDMDDKDMAIIKRDKLIEQMHIALTAADDLIDEYAADCEHRDNVDGIRDEIKAALSAAEGGKR